MVQSLSKPQTPLSNRSAGVQEDRTWTPLNLPPSRLFGTDGIRGRAGDLLNAPFALQLGFWAGQVLRPVGISSGIVILGQDSRNSSDMLAMSLSAGLTAAGLEVWNIGLCPTPCVAYLTAATEAIAGIMISASHNPPEDNGIKFFNAEGTKLSKAVQADIEAALRGHSSASSYPWGRHYHRPELLQDYATSLHQPLVNSLDLQGMRIVLDLAWGAAVPVAPDVFQDLGAEVICLHNRADGDRINVHCGSTHLASLQAAVQEHDADMGFAFDGDADRVIAVDSQGRPVDGDYILYLWGCTLHHANKLPNQTIISTVMANLGFERAWEKLGGTLVRTAVGDQHVHAEMLKTGAMLGGEQSGHILCHHYSLTGDGVQTALHIAAIVRQSGTPLVELVNQSFQPYPQLLKNVRVEDRQTRLNWHACEPLQDAIARATESLGEQGRVLVRASGTEPVVRVMVEASHDHLAEYWTENLVGAVRHHLV
ncbi:phosphoglucosamine mutase [Roseofilum casamattae]|uniref:Phosphoglucosamine mutase n=1 Tax=Roseofilum casamattae BLCC-M143 TaxID=3022442 RepID=A0ABT7BWU9_9CYAN|nr:phosphoglucosamine mutase [Roseofilum casamattae]MDJ1183674.1 phosphoglucosamine mutase [Roseofilum casamattae BLCC-M143]